MKKELEILTSITRSSFWWIRYYNKICRDSEFHYPLEVLIFQQIEYLFMLIAFKIDKIPDIRDFMNISINLQNKLGVKNPWGKIG